MHTIYAEQATRKPNQAAAASRHAQAATMFARRTLLALGLLAGGAFAQQNPCTGLRLLFKPSPEVS